MNINDFINELARSQEGKRKIDVTQIKDILEDVDTRLGGALYPVIRLYCRGRAVSEK